MYNRRMRILIIEDDYKIANSIKKGLEQESYAVDVEYDGKNGLGAVLTLEYDLIILDRMLPEIDGVKICQLLREKGSKLPVLILTAKDKIADRVEGLNAGADDYLVKPFSFEELLARVRALLRRPAGMIDNILKVDDLILDAVNFETKRGNKKINLTKKEFSLLEYMMRNRGKILTKDNIITHVWDFDADILPNTIEVYVGSLRNKIDNNFQEKPPLIKTIRGFGYKIEGKGH